MVACLIYSSLVIVPPANHVVRAVLYRVVWGKSLLCKAQVTSYPFQKLQSVSLECFLTTVNSDFLYVTF